MILLKRMYEVVSTCSLILHVVYIMQSATVYVMQVVCSNCCKRLYFFFILSYSWLSVSNVVHIFRNVMQ